eukprot:s99_g19.t1
MGEDALKAKGWHKHAAECDPHLGYAWTEEEEGNTKSKPIVLYTTKGGQPSGVGITVEQMQWATAKPVAPSSIEEKTANLDVAFRSGAILCSGEKDETTALGTTLIVNPTSSDGNSKTLPLTEAEIKTQGWHRGSCFDGMGWHWFLDTSTRDGTMSWMAKNLFPVVTMYHEGAVPTHRVESHLQYSGCWTVTYREINAIFFAAHLSQVSLPFIKSNEWEPSSLSNENMCKNTCDADCTFAGAMADRGRWPVGGGCPYYGSRGAVSEADVVLGNVLIFDEAHNLLEAINESNSVSLTSAQVKSSVDDLARYAKSYESRLSPLNALRLRQLRLFCAKMHHYLAGLDSPCVQTVGAFLVSAGADNFDLPEPGSWDFVFAGSGDLELAQFLEKTELPRKVRGYMESQAVTTGSTASSIYAVAELLDRLLCQKPEENSGGMTLKYLSLDAEVRFREVLLGARSVLFAGGTLTPHAEFTPLSEQLLVRFVTHGPGGQQLDFRRDRRSSNDMLRELRGVLNTAAASTRGGVVVFFPSFEYLGQVASSFTRGCGGRRVFSETREGSAREEAGGSLLQRVAETIQKEEGAVLFAVSGGKLSEGINFQDDLCRLVIVVGLPYPNASDLALTEKTPRRTEYSLGCLSGREFYSAKCMKAVNQCIGRSIRHARDWAAMLLLDHRYAQKDIAGADLPALSVDSSSTWHAKGESAAPGPFPEVQEQLCKFFAARREAEALSSEALSQ